LKSVSEILYIALDATNWASRGPDQPGAKASGMQGNAAMTLEILNLTAQIQRWLNARVADYLAAQAERLPH
jgi:hypothetical protein